MYEPNVTRLTEVARCRAESRPDCAVNFNVGFDKTFAWLECRRTGNGPTGFIAVADGGDDVTLRAFSEMYSQIVRIYGKRA